MTTIAKTYAAQDFAGEYSFRFGGFAVGPDERLYHIVGVGVFHLSDSGNLLGEHQSTIMALAGPKAATKHSHYFWKGTYVINANGTGTLSVDFHPGSADSPANLHDDFSLVLSETPDRFWFISNGPKIMPEDKSVPEMVSAEAVRIRVSK
ncbi:MAG TPA: hypothetical protein VKP67_08825 [Xanthobacteraceae bacterium]|nr:hypothetical protein [Xanthobacteraceae bacterium]